MTDTRNFQKLRVWEHFSGSATARDINQSVLIAMNHQSRYLEGS